MQLRTVGDLPRVVLSCAELLRPEHLRALEQLALREPYYASWLDSQQGLSDYYFHARVQQLRDGTGGNIRAAHALAMSASSVQRRGALWPIADETTLLTLVRRWPLEEFEEALLVHHPGSSNAVLESAWLHQQFTHPDHRRRAAEILGGPARLYLLLEQIEHAPDDQVLNALRTAPAWLGTMSRERLELLSGVLWSRPHLIDHFASSSAHPIAHTAANSPFLAGRPELISTLVENLLVEPGPAGNRATVVEVHFLLTALIENPATDPGSLDRLETRLEHFSNSGRVPSQTRALLQSTIRRLQSRRAQRLPVLTGTLDQVDQADLLHVLLARALPSPGRPAGRPYEVYSLARNPLVHSTAAASVQELLAALVLPETQRLLAFLPSADLAGVVQELTRCAVAAGSLSAQQAPLYTMAVPPAQGRTSGKDRLRMRVGLETQRLARRRSSSSLDPTPVLARRLEALVEPTADSWHLLFTLSQGWHSDLEDLVEAVQLLGTSEQ
jgi:hypothetical protein